MTSRVTSVRMMHIIPWPVYGGPHNEAMILGVHAARHEWRLTVVLPTDAESSAIRLRNRGIGVENLPLTRLRRTRSVAYWLLYPLRFLFDVLSLLRLMKRQQVDLVESSSVNLQAALAGRLAGAAVVWRVAGCVSPGDRPPNVRPSRSLIG